MTADCAVDIANCAKLGPMPNATGIGPFAVFLRPFHFVILPPATLNFGRILPINGIRADKSGEGPERQMSDFPLTKSRLFTI